MTIDERLDRLTERHEALTQSIEILVAMQRDSEPRIARLEASMQELSTTTTSLSTTTSRLSTAMTDLSTTMNRLANIVIRHEERLDSIDGGGE